MLARRVPRDTAAAAAPSMGEGEAGADVVYREIKSPVDEIGEQLAGAMPAGGAGSTHYHTTQVAQHLFNVMSGRAEIDHPLCEECTDTLLDQVLLMVTNVPDTRCSPHRVRSLTPKTGMWRKSAEKRLSF